MSPEKLLELIQDNDYIFVAQAAAEPAAILSHMQHLKNTGVKNAWERRICGECDAERQGIVTVLKIGADP